MKLAIGTKVYCIYGNGILVDEVAFVGKDSFIIESFHRSTYEDSWEWYYEDYGTKWFLITDFSKAKQELLSRFKDGLVLKKINDDWYELVEEDEI